LLDCTAQNSSVAKNIVTIPNHAPIKPWFDFDGFLVGGGGGDLDVKPERMKLNVCEQFDLGKNE
jgi:hypothetical protein